MASTDREGVWNTSSEEDQPYTRVRDTGPTLGRVASSEVEGAFGASRVENADTSGSSPYSIAAIRQRLARGRAEDIELQRLRQQEAEPKHSNKCMSNGGDLSACDCIVGWGADQAQEKQ